MKLDPRGLGRKPGGMLDAVRVARAAGYSLSGLRSAWRYHTAFRQEAALGVILAPAGVWLADTGVERALLLGSLALVLVVELLNSAIEDAVDRVGSEPHELSGRAKDIGSAAVFLAILSVPLVWGLVLLG